MERIEKNQYKSLKLKSDTALAELILDLKFNLLKMRFKLAQGEDIRDVSKFKKIRKTIAIIMTIFSERKIKISFSPNALQLCKQIDSKKQEISVVKYKHKVEKADKKEKVIGFEE